MIKNVKFEIFLTSFCILFLELALIRFLPSQIAYLGYYSNFILLAVFIGMGGGILLAKKTYDLSDLFPWFLLLTIAVSSLFSVSVYSSATGEIHFGTNTVGLVMPEYLFVPIIFMLVAMTTACLAQRLGVLLDRMPPLSAYTWDIIGSLAGILLFSIFSYFSLSPLSWFLAFSLVFVIGRWRLSWQMAVSVIPLVLVLAILLPISKGVQWSPYQKVSYESVYDEGQPTPKFLGYRVSVNNINHQFIAQDLETIDGIYHAPYVSFNDPTYDNVLVIGAGTGTDVAVALKNNVSHVDAVDIDPKLLQLGYDLNPHHPYQDARVSTYVDDARSFLQKNKTKYDLIIFALPDSLVLASGRGNIRLESFLFTKEAFESARQRLAPDGLLVLYNYYRQPWLIEKLDGMLEEVFQQTPHVTMVRDDMLLAALMVGEKLSDLSPQASSALVIETHPQPATDDWPFIYLSRPSLPGIYIVMLVFLALAIFLALSALIRKPLYRTINPTYFFLGAAFMLLETESVVRFSLLFGGTWIVNALVFFAILSLVLVAIKISARLQNSNPLFWYVGLAISLIVQYTFPLQKLLALDVTLKYLTVTVLTFAPVFFANIIFSLTFKRSTANADNFAANILGATVGGFMEYSALLLGYRNIILLIIVFYFLAFAAPFLKWQMFRRIGGLLRQKG